MHFKWKLAALLCTIIGRVIVADQPQLDDKEVCGILHSNEQFNDPNLAMMEEFPWVVAISYRDRNRNERVDTFRCLGTLLTSKHVLTSASCVDVDWWLLKIDMIQVGVYNVQNKGLECVKNVLSNDCTASTLSVHVDKVVIFPTYDPTSLENNIAIIKLTPNVTYTDCIRPICLEDHEINNNMKYNYSYWTTGYSMEDKNHLVKVADRNIIGEDECNTKLSNYFQRNDYNMTRNTFCTRDNGMKDACIMDAGSPLFYRSDSDGRWYQEGVSSFNTNCTLNGVSVYTQVADYFSWIVQTIRKL